MYLLCNQMILLLLLNYCICYIQWQDSDRNTLDSSITVWILLVLCPLLAEGMYWKLQERAVSAVSFSDNWMDSMVVLHFSYIVHLNVLSNEAPPSDNLLAFSNKSDASRVFCHLAKVVNWVNHSILMTKLPYYGTD